MPQNFPQRREARYLIAERFECGGDRDRDRDDVEVDGGEEDRAQHDGQRPPVSRMHV